MILIVSVLVGLVVGSYLGCLVYRLPRNKDTVWSRSRCVNCNHILSWKDLIPVFSFMWLRAKCRYCKKGLSKSYPIIEIVTACLFLLSTIFISNLGILSIFYSWILISLLVAVAFVDLFNFLILDKIIISGFVVSLVAIFLTKFGVSLDIICSNLSCGWLDSFLGVLFFAGILGTIFLISSGQWIGFGDVKLAIWIGFLFGFPRIINVFYFTFFLGALVGILLLIFRKADRKTPLPLGTFIVVASIFLLIFPINLLPQF